eukprot:1285355-Amphidinium_carterae.1
MTPVHHSKKCVGHQALSDHQSELQVDPNCTINQFRASRVVRNRESCLQHEANASILAVVGAADAAAKLAQHTADLAEEMYAVDGCPRACPCMDCESRLRDSSIWSWLPLQHKGMKLPRHAISNLLTGYCCPLPGGIGFYNAIGILIGGPSVWCQGIKNGW